MFGKSYKTGVAKNGSQYASFTVDKAELEALLSEVKGERASVTIFTEEKESQRGPFTSVSISIRELQKPKFEAKKTFVRKSTLNKVVE